MKYYKYYLVSLFVLVIDQLSKILVYLNMEMGTVGEIPVLGTWFKLHYLLNPGMAFGLELDWAYGKLFLTVFRIIASLGIGYAIYVLAKNKNHNWFIVCVALIFGGAVGNVIDSVFYGVFLEGNVIPNSVTPWFHGRVIDMLYFPMFRGAFPEWLPFWGGESFLFFSPVFNIADSSIFVGVVSILLFQNKFQKHEEERALQNAEANTEVNPNDQERTDKASTSV